MEILDKATFDSWRQETLSFLKYKFRGSRQADCEDAVSEAFYLLIKDQQNDYKLTFTVNTIKRLAYCRAVDAWRKEQRRPPTDCQAVIPPSV